ncbi:MAG: DUF6615 family protein [Bacteroidota bacterium]
MNICQTFKDLAQKTWDMLATSRAVSYPMQEETFTDLHLLHLKQHHPEVKIVNFTKPQEGVNGADWEWWFKLPDSSWIGYRVQAKVLDVRTEEFAQLYYQKDKSSVSQCDKLIAAAKADKSNPCIPLYVLYLQTDAHAPSVHSEHGCSLVSAYEIRAAKGVKGKAMADWYKDIIPWHELVCPIVKDSKTWHNSIDRFLDRQSISPKKESIEQYRLEAPPGYILQGMNTELGLAIAESNPHDIAGAVIFDLFTSA